MFQVGFKTSYARHLEQYKVARLVLGVLLIYILQNYMEVRHALYVERAFHMRRDCEDTWESTQERSHMLVIFVGKDSNRQEMWRHTNTQNTRAGLWKSESVKGNIVRVCVIVTCSNWIKTYIVLIDMREILAFWKLYAKLEDLHSILCTFFFVVWNKMSLIQI